MPQLNPSPWFLVMFFSWIIFLTFTPLKFQGHIFPNDPMPEVNKDFDSPWCWPWP